MLLTDNYLVFLSYRTRDEVQRVRQKRDPITGLRDRIISAGLAEAGEIKASLCGCYGGKVWCSVHR